MKPSLLIFDLFKTLIYPVEKIKREDFFKFYRKLGIELKTEKDIKLFSQIFAQLMTQSASWREVSQKLLEKTISVKNPKTIDRLANFFEANIVYQFYEDVKEIISLPHQKAILTSGSRFLFSSLGLEKNFEVFTPIETKILKPDKRAFLMVIKKFGTPAKKATMIGDDVVRDLIPAQELGIKTILIDRGNEVKNYSGAKISSLGELKNILGL
jgi:FMN phosphatase YigB (HAD superfamily)